MKKNILFISFVLLQLFANTLSAQLQHKRNISPTDWQNRYAYDCDQCQKNAEFVFEGKEIARRFYAINDSQFVKTLLSRVVRITKVFKGKLKLGNIELIEESELGLLKNSTINSYKKEIIVDTCSNIYFCNTSNKYLHDVNSIGYKFINKTIMESCTIYQIHDYKCNRNKSRIFGYDSVFISKASLYNYLRSEYQIVIPKNAEDKGDTTSSLSYHNYIDWYKETILHQKVPTLMERIAMQEKRFHYVNDSLDSVESYKYMLNIKTEINARNRAEKSPFIYKIYWDGNLRSYSGESEDTTKNRPRRNGFENN